MRKCLKRITAAALCLIIAVTICLPGFADEEKTAYIIVSGMNTFPLYDENENRVWPLSTGTIVKLVADILPDVMSYFVTKDARKLADRILPVAYRVFEPIACAENGDSKYPLHTLTFDGRLGDRAELFTSMEKDEEGVVHAAIDRFGLDNTYFFNYDWRIDPLCHADNLDKFIKDVKALGGYDRISLLCFSMGGTIVSSYLHKYGSGEIDTVEFCSTAFEGSSIVGELFRGKLEVDIEALIDRVASLVRNDTLKQIFDYLNAGLTENGFNGNVTDFANNLISEIGGRVFDELLIPVFGYMPGIWALTPYDYFEECKDYILKNNNNADLLARIEEYHNSVQGNLSDTLHSALGDTNVYITAQYNMRGVPVAEEITKSNNDFLIDCRYASGGATVSLLHETLGEGYTQKLYSDIDYLSPDGQIDASTCILPDKTWFIRDMAHVDYPYGGDAAEFVLDLASSEEQQTVFTSKWSQFMKYDYSEKTLTPVNADTGKDVSFLGRVLAFFDRIRSAIYSFLDKINIFNLIKQQG